MVANVGFERHVVELHILSFASNLEQAVRSSMFEEEERRGNFQTKMKDKNTVVVNGRKGLY